MNSREIDVFRYISRNLSDFFVQFKIFMSYLIINMNDYIIIYL